MPPPALPCLRSEWEHNGENVEREAIAVSGADGEFGHHYWDFRFKDNAEVGNIAHAVGLCRYWRSAVLDYSCIACSLLDSLPLFR